MPSTKPCPAQNHKSKILQFHHKTQEGAAKSLCHQGIKSLCHHRFARNKRTQPQRDKVTVPYTTIPMLQHFQVLSHQDLPVPISQTAQLVWCEPGGEKTELYLAKHPPKGDSWGGQVFSATPGTVKAGPGLANSWNTSGEGINLSFCS